MKDESIYIQLFPLRLERIIIVLKIINFLLFLLIIWVVIFYPFRFAWFEGLKQIPPDLHGVYLLFLFFGYLICSSAMGLMVGKMFFKRKEQ